MALPKKIAATTQLASMQNCIGHLVAVSDTGVPLVDFQANTGGPIAARSALTQADIERLQSLPAQVLLMFENGDATRPIIAAIVGDTIGSQTFSATLTSGEVLKPQSERHAFIDGKRVVFNAQEEIMLQCGKSSILLRKDGKVVIKGKQVISRSSGSNKIKGSSVSIN